MLENEHGYRSEATAFEVAGAHVRVIDPAGALVDLPAGPVPLLHPAAFPPPLAEVAVLASESGRAEAGEVVVRFEGRITIAPESSPGRVHPAVVGAAYVAPLFDALSRLLTSDVAAGPVAAGPPEGQSPMKDGEDPGPAVAPSLRDDGTGLTATVTYGRPRPGGRVTHLVRAAAVGPGPAELEGFVRIVLEVARRQAGFTEPGDGETFLTGRTFTLSRHVVPDGDQEVRLESIGGLDDVVDQLREVADSFRHPEVMARWGARRPQGVLMSGPPGTGKTSLARALATEIGGTLKEIRTPDILDKWVGSSERNIKKIFAEARRYRTPTVLLFDEFDSIISYAGAPNGAADQAVNSVAGIFKQEMNGLVDANPNVIVVATTNFPDRVDDSLTRSGRFDVKITVGLPDVAGRAEILTKMLRGLVNRHETQRFRMFDDDIDVGELAIVTAGMSGADLKEMLRRAQMAKAMQEVRDAAAAAITQADLRAIVTRMRRDGGDR